MDSLQKDIYFVNRISYRMNLKKKKDRLWNARCPICGDSAKSKAKKRFYIYEKKGKMKTTCHNCGWFSSFYGFLKEQFPDLLDEYRFFGFTKKESVVDKLRSELDSKPITEVQRPTFVAYSQIKALTIDYNLLKDNHPAKKYVVNRRIPLDKVRYCKNFYQFTKKLHQNDTFKHYAIPSIILPFFRLDDKIEILQARFYDPKVKPKYITVKFNEESLKIYNKDFVDEESTVWILEGPIDSMHVPNAVAMAGSDATYHFKDQVWVFDNERHNDEIIQKMSKKIQKKEKVVIWRKTDAFKDINEGVCAEKINEAEVVQMLRARTFKGLKASLEFAKFKEG